MLAKLDTPETENSLSLASPGSDRCSPIGSRLKSGLTGAVVAATLSVLGSGTTFASTIVQVSKDYANHQVSEGYAGDVDQMLQDFDEARANPTPENQFRHRVDFHDIQITDIGSTVYSDLDHDGYFTHFSLSLDVDSYHGDAWVYAKIYLRTDETDYELFHTSGIFEIYGSLASDRYKLDSKLVSNYEAAYYDIRVEIYESTTHQLYDAVDASTHRTLYALPLESDRFTSGHGDAIVHEHVGSLTGWGLFVIGLFACIRRMGKRKPSTAS